MRRRVKDSGGGSLGKRISGNEGNGEGSANEVQWGKYSSPSKPAEEIAKENMELKTFAGDASCSTSGIDNSLLVNQVLAERSKSKQEIVVHTHGSSNGSNFAL